MSFLTITALRRRPRAAERRARNRGAVLGALYRFDPRPLSIEFLGQYTGIGYTRACIALDTLCRDGLVCVRRGHIAAAPILMTPTTPVGLTNAGRHHVAEWGAQ